MQKWYVAQTQPMAEHKALAHLHRQGFEVYLPRYLKRRSHARRVDYVPVPVFPRYLFVGMDIESCRWRAINSTFGVSRLVCFGDLPAPVPDGIVEEFRAREDERGLVGIGGLMQFEQGAPVQVTDGPLKDATGLFQCTTDDQRVVVLLSLLGRELRVEVERDALCAV